MKFQGLICKQANPERIAGSFLLNININGYIPNAVVTTGMQKVIAWFPKVVAKYETASNLDGTPGCAHDRQVLEQDSAEQVKDKAAAYIEHLEALLLDAGVPREKFRSI